jgi:hypothetical protein
VRVPGIGELVDSTDCWRLKYEGCGHVQFLVQLGLEDPEVAEAYVRRHFKECLLCRAARRTAVPAVVPLRQ